MHPATTPVSIRLTGVTTLVQLETLALCAFAFVLPQFEAPKNLLWLIYVALWLTNRWRARDFGGPWDGWDSLIAVWLVSGFVSAFYGGLQTTGLISSLDVMRYGSVLWLIRRSGYREQVLKQVLACLVLGTLAGLLKGYYELLFVPRADGQRRYLGLNSVGHVNHSAIYLAIVFGSALAWVLGAWQYERLRRRVIGCAVCISLVLSLFVMESRATVGVSLLAGIVLIVVYTGRTGKNLWRVLAGTALLILVIGVIRPEVVEKNSARLKENNMFAFRDNIWRAGLVAWHEFPALGVGIGNYGKIDYPRLEQWSSAKGEVLDRSRVLTQSHGHSLYINTLVERGAVGLLAVIAVLVGWGWSVFRTVPAANETAVRWAYWGGSLAAWLVATMVGFVNTTLHHEHALVSMVLLGGWLCLRKRPPIHT